MHHSHLSRSLAGIVTVAAVIALAACGDDDNDAATDTEPAAATDEPDASDGPATTGATTAATSGSTAPSGSSAGAGDVDAFCEAEIAVEGAVFAEDPEALGPAFEALAASAPADVKESTDTAIAEAEAFLAADSEPTEEFNAAYAELMEYVKANCGFTNVDVEAVDYAFNGVPRELAAGPAVITFENAGTEAHEMALMRVNDGVTENLIELLALPEEEAMTKVDPTVGAGTFAVPGDIGYTAVDLTAGRWIAVCFVPEGMTMDVMEQMDTSGTEPATMGQPHFTLGMAQEIMVS